MAIPLIGYAAASSYVFPAAAGLMRFRALNRAMKLFAALTVLTFLQVVAQYLVALMGSSNYMIINNYMAIECALFLAVFALSAGFRRTRRVIAWSIIFLLAFWILDKICFEIPTQINSTVGVVTRILLIGASLTTLHNMWKTHATPLPTTPVFWVATGVVLYSAGTLFVLGLSNRLLLLGLFYFEVGWYINCILILVSNALFVKAFLCRTQ